MPRIVSNAVEVFPFRRRPTGVEFLLLRRFRDDYLGGTWHAVHGSIEPQETAVQAALRELREEAGLRPVRLWQLDSVSTFYLARTDSVRLEPCFAAEVAAEAAVALSAEHSAYRWVGAHRVLAELMWPNQRRAVREILEEILRPARSEPHLRIALDDLPADSGD